MLHYLTPLRLSLRHHSSFIILVFIFSVYRSLFFTFSTRCQAILSSCYLTILISHCIIIYCIFSVRFGLLYFNKLIVDNVDVRPSGLCCGNRCLWWQVRSASSVDLTVCIRRGMIKINNEPLNLRHLGCHTPREKTRENGNQTHNARIAVLNYSHHWLLFWIWF